MLCVHSVTGDKAELWLREKERSGLDAEERRVAGTAGCSEHEQSLVLACLFLQCSKKVGRVLDKDKKRIYTKRELRLLLRTGTGAGATRFSVPYGCHCDILVFDPDPPHMGRGQLLHGVRRHEQDYGQGGKQGEPGHSGGIALRRKDS